MDASYFSALSGLAGAAIGGLTSFGTNWLTQRTQMRAQSLGEVRNQREKLFVEFMREASRLYADALSHERDDIADMVNLFATVSHLRMVSSPETIAAAENATNAIIVAYHGPNRTLGELRDFAKDGGFDPLMEFGWACRAELAALQVLTRQGAG